MKNFILFISIIFLGRASWFMTMPFLAVYFSQTLHAGPIAIGVVLGAGLLSSCVSGLFIGGLIDRFSVKSILILGSIVSAIIFLTFAAPLTLLGYGLLNLLLGVCRSLIDTASQSYIMDLLPPEKRSMGLNIRYTIINVSSTAGPLIGAFLISHSAPTLFMIAASIYIISVILMACMPTSQKHPSEGDIWRSLQASSKLLWQNQIAKIIFLIEACYCIGFAQIETTLPQVMGIRFDGSYVYAYSWVLATNAIVVVSSQLFINRILRFISIPQTALLTFGLFALAFLGAAFAHEVKYFIGAMIIFTYGEVVGVALYNQLINQYSTEKNRGSYFGVMSFALIGFPIGTCLGGILLKGFGGTNLFICIALLGGISGYYIFWLSKKEKLAHFAKS